MPLFQRVNYFRLFRLGEGRREAGRDRYSRLPLALRYHRHRLTSAIARTPSTTNIRSAAVIAPPQTPGEMC